MEKGEGLKVMEWGGDKRGIKEGSSGDKAWRGGGQGEELWSGGGFRVTGRVDSRRRFHEGRLSFGEDVPTIVNQKNWNLRIATRASRSHRTGTEYNAIQNTFESVALIWRCGWNQSRTVGGGGRGGTSALSKTQTLSPSGPVSFHHLNPHSNLPETFFTVQKSKASKRTIITKRKILHVTWGRESGVQA